MNAVAASSQVSKVPQTARNQADVAMQWCGALHIGTLHRHMVCLPCRFCGLARHSTSSKQEVLLLRQDTLPAAQEAQLRLASKHLFYVY